MGSIAAGLRKILYAFVAVIFLAAAAYAAYYIVSARSPLFPADEVCEITQWTYVDELDKETDITTPLRVDTDGRDVFIFRSVMPDAVPDGAVIAFLTKSDFTVEIDGNVVKKWTREEAPVIGGPAKTSYFIIPLEPEDAGSTISFIVEGRDFSGWMMNAAVGNKYDVVRFLETKNGPFQFAFAFALLIASFALVAVGVVLRFLYSFEIKLTKMAIGTFIAGSWIVTNSYVFQFVFRTQFIDGFMSYMSTLCIALPFIGYLDAIQDYRYEKCYIAVSLYEILSLIVFAGLHLSHILNFSKGLPYIDLNIAIAIVICFSVTVYDIVKGNVGDYKPVAYGFLVFMILAIVEIVLINLDAIRTEGGVVVIGLYVLLAFAIAQQIKEIRQIQVERDRANEEGAAKTQFLASMSHEIRTPINSILGMNEMILRECNDPDIREYAEIIGKSGDLLLSLINDILDVSKIGNDMEEIICADYDPGKMFDDAADMLVSLADEKGLRSRIGKPRNLPDKLYGDEKRIVQIIVNLISNAVKYTEEGSVTFTGECFEKGSGYELCFYVSDTGIGIKKEDIDGIFDPFLRLEPGRNQSIQGTGLGLSIVKGLVDKMDGSISVDSTYGKGSTFSVRIPQGRSTGKEYNGNNILNNAGEDDLEGIDPNYIAPEARILEVDDNVSNQVVVQQFLKETCATLDVASGGQEALRLCRLNKYDVILMDHMMPDPDGIQTMHMIRSEAGSLNAATPEIILTANAIMGSRSQYEAEGFDNYLSKPVDSKRLLKMIRKYLPEEKVMYKPAKRTYARNDDAPAPAPKQVMPKADTDGPIDFTKFYARVDNKADTVALILEEVVKESAVKIPLLRELAEAGDLKRYAIEAHGIKGSMAGIDAASLSEHARKHEFAAKGGDTGFIMDDLDGFIGEYESVIEYIKHYLSEED